MRAVSKALGAFFLGTVLAACGGGGGSPAKGDTQSEPGGSGGNESPLSLLSFAPSKITTNVASGNSATITVRAMAQNLSVFSSSTYVKLVDKAGVLARSVELASIDSATISATIHTLPTLAIGRHQGSFEVQLCRDVDCVAQVEGSPVSLPYDITVSDGPLHLLARSSTAVSVHRGGSIAGQVPVTVFGPSGAWTATSSANWMRVTGGSGSGGGAFTIGYDTATLSEGSYAAAVTVRSQDGQVATLPVTLEVLPAQFSITSGMPSFAAVNGAPIPPQTLTFEINNRVPTAWSATSLDPWLQVSQLHGTTPAVVSFQPDPSRGSLPSGTYSADTVLSSSGIADSIVTARLKLSKPVLSAPSDSITLGGPKGRDFDSGQTLSVSLNTGANSWPFILSGLPEWLSSTTPSGSVNQSGSTLAVVPKSEQVTTGSKSATVTVRAKVNGDVVTLPLTVNLNADQRRLLASEWGVAFSSSPNGTALTRSLKIHDNFAGELNWTATSDAPWLHITSSGNTGAASGMTLTADPSSLPLEAVSYAKVTVRTTTAGVEPAVIRVAVWRSARALSGLVKLPLTYREIVADKIRPYVYTIANGGTVDVFNAHTAQKIGTISGAGTGLRKLSVSPDGSRLYALDGGSTTISVIDLDTWTKLAAWPMDLELDSEPQVLASRVSGVDVVFVGNGRAYANGRSLGRTGILGSMVASLDGRTVYTNSGMFDLDYSAMSGGVLFANRLNYTGPFGMNVRDLAVSQDGSRAYEAAGGGVSDMRGYHCAAYNPAGGPVGILEAEAYPNNVEATRDGRAICGINGSYSSFDFRLYTADGVLLRSVKVASGYNRTLWSQALVVTPDGFVVTALTDDPQIVFVPIPIGP